MRVSVVIPVFNEEDSILPLVKEFVPVAEALPGLELLIVDDGSRDATPDRLRECAPSHPFLTPCRTEANRGQSAAMLSGLRAARGDVLVTMDGDLQNNPRDIPALVARLESEGLDVVCGYRAKRRDTWSRRAASRIGNTVRNWFTQDGMRDTGCSLKVFRRACADVLPPLNGVHRFMPAYFKIHGYRMAEAPVDHRPRQHGSSKYTNLMRLPRTIFDLIGFVWYRRRRLASAELIMLKGSGESSC